MGLLDSVVVLPVHPDERQCEAYQVLAKQLVEAAEVHNLRISVSYRFVESSIVLRGIKFVKMVLSSDKTT